MISQKEAIEKFMPQIDGYGQTYEKFAKVKARPADEGEKIDTVTSDGKETTNTAKEGDYVVKNPTGEEYILSAKKLESRYKKLGDEKGKWTPYQATGECIAVRYNGKEMKFKASWDEGMVLKPGDMICTPLPDKDEVYRIAAKEFKETYRLKNA